MRALAETTKKAIGARFALLQPDENVPHSLVVMTLLGGTQVVEIPEEVVKDGERLARSIEAVIMDDKPLVYAVFGHYRAILLPDDAPEAAQREAARLSQELRVAEHPNAQEVVILQIHTPLEGALWVASVYRYKMLPPSIGIWRLGSEGRHPNHILVDEPS